MASHFKQAYTEDIDRQVEASPMAAESITKLHTGEGARRFAAKPRAQRERSSASTGVLIGVAIAAIAVIVAGFLLVRALLGPKSPEAGDEGAQVAPAEQSAAVSVDPATGEVDSEAVAFDGGDEGETISIIQVEGAYAVAATGSYSNSVRTLFVLEGEPAGLLLANGVVLVPENLADGWDVICYVMGAESVASPVVGADGAEVRGQGTVEEAHLEGGELVVKDSTGAMTRIAL